MHYFDLVILCSEMFDFIHNYDLTCKHPHIYNSRYELYSKNKLFKQNKGYEDVLSCL